MEGSPRGRLEVRADAHARERIHLEVFAETTEAAGVHRNIYGRGQRPGARENRWGLADRGSDSRGREEVQLPAGGRPSGRQGPRLQPMNRNPRLKPITIIRR